MALDVAAGSVLLTLPLAYVESVACNNLAVVVTDLTEVTAQSSVFVLVNFARAEIKLFKFKNEKAEKLLLNINLNLAPLFRLH